jgi:hypothetical protein
MAQRYAGTGEHASERVKKVPVRFTLHRLLRAAHCSANYQLYHSISQFIFWANRQIARSVNPQGFSSGEFCKVGDQASWLVSCLKDPAAAPQSAAFGAARRGGTMKQKNELRNQSGAW